MLKEKRQQLILNLLYQHGQVQVDALAAEFSASRDTIRRDLSELEAQGILKRVYGGAVPQKQLAAGIDLRKGVQRDEKYQVACKAVGLLKPDSMIVIDGGTTNALFASLIPLSMPIRVVTNSFPVAQALWNHPEAQVTFLGGRCNKGSKTTVGETVYAQLKNYRFDQCFLGAYGVDARNGVSVVYPYEDEVGVKQFFVEHSREVNVMASCSKLDVTANSLICPLSRVERILCERPVSKQQQARYQNKIY